MKFNRKIDQLNSNLKMQKLQVTDISNAYFMNKTCKKN